MRRLGPEARPAPHPASGSEATSAWGRREGLGETSSSAATAISGFVPV